MDDGKDFLGTAGAENANAFDTPVQPPTHPANSTAAPDSAANGQIISSAGLPTATPLTAPLPTDPLHPTQTVGSGSGDIWVGGGGKASKKKLSIGGIIIGVVLLLIVGMVTLLVSENKVSPQTTFATYQNYLKYGAADKNEIVTGDEWYLFEAKSLLTDEEYADYIAKLRESSDAFVATLEEIEAANGEVYYREAKFGREELEFILLILSLSDIETELQETYFTDSKAAAAGLVEEKTEASSYSELINTAYATLREYLDNEIVLLETYVQYGCTVDSYVDFGCVAEAEAEDIDLQDFGYDNLMSTYDDIKLAFQTLIDNFNDELGNGSNA